VKSPRRHTSRFITFEGLDGSDKSTHLHRAGEWMKAHDLGFRTTREPGGTPLGKEIRALFLDHRWGELDGRVEALMVFASRRQHLLQVIEPALAAGQHVLCDRFTDSTHAYQGEGRGLDRRWIEDLDQLATDCRQPDFTLFFDLPLTMARERSSSPDRQGGVDRLDAEVLEFYERVRDRYLELANDEPERILRVDSSGSRQATWLQVERILGKLMGVG